MKDIEIVFKKLGRWKADGLAWNEDNVIEIDSRLKGFELLETIVHEIMHIQNPKWGEIKIQGHSKQIAELLWDLGYRKVEHL